MVCDEEWKALIHDQFNMISKLKVKFMLESSCGPSFKEMLADMVDLQKHFCNLDFLFKQLHHSHAVTQAARICYHAAAAVKTSAYVSRGFAETELAMNPSEFQVARMLTDMERNDILNHITNVTLVYDNWFADNQ